MENRAMAMQRITFSLILILWLSGCGSKVVTTPPSFPDRKISKIPFSRPSSTLALIPHNSLPSFSDDLDRDSLNLAIKRSLQYFSRFRDTDLNFFGNRPCTIKEMRETLSAFSEIINGIEADSIKEEKIRNTFDFYQSAGDDGRGRIIFTGYYEPLLAGSLTKTEKYRYPLYRVPEETLVQFNNKNDRLVGRVSKGEFVPHYKRAEIDGSGVLAGRNLEIVWVSDFVELFFLHIQGSGKIQLPDGRIMQVGYAQSNGHPYRSIANYLIQSGKLSKDAHTQQAIKKFLREHPEETMDIFNYNERYVFFRVLDQGPLGALNIPVTGGRTIASDLEIFPKGALALIKARKPLIYMDNKLSWMPFSRFVLNQDAGAAITGAGRIDLFCGTGKDAEQVAGRLKEGGVLYFLMKK